MKLHIENFAKIKEADIEINGITVIAGENNTGKSTIGKIMYCLYSIFKDIDLKINNERKRSIARALVSTSKFRNMMYHDKNDESEEFMDFVNEIFNAGLENLDFYLKTSNINFSDETKAELYAAVKFDKNELESLIIKKYFSNEFYDQFLPLIDTNDKSFLSLLIKDNENTIYFKNNKKIIVNSELNLIKDCIYIDNPFSLDEMKSIYKEDKTDIFNFILKGSNIFTHDEFLISRLSKSLKENDSDLIGHALLDKRLLKFQSMIKDVVHGDFLEKENRFVFFDYYINREIELKNLSTGIKSLAILLKLLENRDISDKSMIVLDEPEIHLHPKWQLEFAEILVLLQKEFDLNIVITSHSPYFINAIEAYSSKYETADRCKYYLASLDNENRSYFEDVTTNIDKIYFKLSQPLIELEEIL